ncbi:MAG: hypothetical protein H0U18_09965 [Pyrinomonadaceae bacterium]|nr:hypothetical protein [Pyrinomonadaceae bacterium]
MIDLERKAFIFDKIDYKPHSADQQAIHDSDARFKILCCGRRYGKTTFGANEMTAAICDPTQEGYYWIVGPNYTQGEKEFRIVFNNILKKLPFGSKVKKQYNVPQGLMRIEMPWGSVLEVKSADRQESLLGEGLKGVIMAEAARHTSVTWEQYVRPALSDKSGWAIFTSTPRGYNWFQGLWMLGQTRVIHPLYESWRLPSWDNPLAFPGGRTDPEILEMEAQTSPNFFAQEIAADFTAFTGKIYDEFEPNVHIKQIEYNPLWQNFWAFDYGWANAFVCLDIMVDPEDNVYIWREYQKSNVSSWDHGHILQGRANPDHFHVDGMFGDPRGGDSRYTLELVLGQIWSDEPKDEGTNSSWGIGVEFIKRWLKPQANGKPKLFIDPSCADLIRQLEQLRAPDAKEGINSKEGQHKHDDHGPDALRYFFSQYFGMGYGSSLSDVYSPTHGRSEAATFFQQQSRLERNARF